MGDFQLYTLNNYNHTQKVVIYLTTQNGASSQV